MSEHECLSLGASLLGAMSLPPNVSAVVESAGPEGLATVLAYYTALESVAATLRGGSSSCGCVSGAGGDDGEGSGAATGRGVDGVREASVSEALVGAARGRVVRLATFAPPGCGGGGFSCEGSAVYDKTGERVGATERGGHCGGDKGASLSGVGSTGAGRCGSVDNGYNHGPECGGFGLVEGSRPVVIVRGQERGPNYLRNRANRLRRKVQRQERLRWVTEEVGDEEKKLLDLRVRRQTLQEEAKLRRLQSPSRVVEEAMVQVALAQKYSSMAGDSRVAKWAAGLTSASAESLARSSGASLSGESVASGASPRGVASGSVGRFSQGRVDVLKGSASRASSGSVGGSVRSVDSMGVPYTQATARSWVRSYEYLELHAAKGFKGRELAKAASISFGELEKYYRLKKEFGI